MALLAAYVEGVRVGFDRWGDSFASEMVDNGQLDEGFYKVAPRFAVQVVNAPVGDGPDAERVMQVQDSFLVMPQDLQYREQGALMYRGFTIDEFMNQLFGNELDYGKGRPDKLRQRSRQRFATRASLVEDRLNRWIGSDSARGLI